MRLYQRANGKWYVEFKRGVHRSLKTQDEAEARELFSGIEQQETEAKLKKLNTSQLTLSEWTEIYISNRGDLDPDTIRADRLALRSLKDAIGDLPINYINASQIDSFKTKCLKRGLKPVSINVYLRHIRASLYAAADLNYIKKFKIKLVKVPGHLPRILTSNEIEILLKNATTEMARFINFALYTGCRREEILNFKWQHVSGTKAIVTGKGDKQRYLKLVPPALDAMGPKKDIGPVFAQWHKDTLSKRFKALADKCKIRGVRFHTLRHTSATRMLETGIPIEVVQAVLGHSDIRTTQIYAKVTNKIIDAEMVKLRF